uniref:Uncharacterized protein n=1 Tax=Lutzomyia longipalpis TaxID=7200 RepID=A0A1B0GJT4_LUTLO
MMKIVSQCRALASALVEAPARAFQCLPPLLMLALASALVEAPARAFQCLPPLLMLYFHKYDPIGGSMPNTSSSVPFLLSSSMQSIRSRRPSTCLSSGPLGSGSGLLQQLGSGMGGSMPNTSSSVPFLLSSSMQSIRSRRPSTCLSSGPLGSGSGLLQQLGSGML